MFKSNYAKITANADDILQQYGMDYLNEVFSPYRFQLSRGRTKRGKDKKGIKTSCGSMKKTSVTDDEQSSDCKTGSEENSENEDNTIEFQGIPELLKAIAFNQN